MTKPAPNASIEELKAYFEQSATPADSEEEE